MPIMKILKTLRNHWKKSTFAAVLLTYGGNYLKDKYETNELMREYCEEAKKYGDFPIKVGQKPRHVTVILNPAAKDGKGESLFEKFSSPLLHLAGIKVSIVKTEHEGQARSLMEVMENTDAVLIAGGDGTLAEVVTGLFRREDSDSAARRFPVGIVPVGRTNTVASNLFWTQRASQVKLLAASTMAVIKEVTRPLDVMAVQVEAGSQPVYSLAGLHWGIFRDTEVLIPKYWYWGPLKQRVAFIFAALKSWPDPLTGQLQYVLPCEGCSKCYTKSVTVARRGRWWHAFLPRSAPEVPSKDYSQVSNPECGEPHAMDINTRQLQISTANTTPGCQERLDHGLEVSLFPGDVGRWSFITEGWARVGVAGPTPDSGVQTFQARHVTLTPNIPEESWFNIDNEAFEARPVDVHVLPSKLRVFCPWDQ